MPTENVQQRRWCWDERGDAFDLRRCRCRERTTFVGVHRESNPLTDEWDQGGQMMKVNTNAWRNQRPIRASRRCCRGLSPGREYRSKNAWDEKVWASSA